MGATLHDPVDRTLIFPALIQLDGTSLDAAHFERHVRRPGRTEPAVHVLQEEQLHHTSSQRQKNLSDITTTTLSGGLNKKTRPQIGYLFSRRFRAGAAKKTALAWPTAATSTSRCRPPPRPCTSSSTETRAPARTPAARTTLNTSTWRTWTN